MSLISAASSRLNGIFRTVPERAQTALCKKAHAANRQRGYSESMKMTLALAAALVCAGSFSSCSRDAQAITPEAIEQQYGVSGAFKDTVSTSDGSMKGTLVPVTLANGQKAQLFIPEKQANQPHPVYLR